MSFFLSARQLLSRKDKATFDRLDYLMSKEDNYKRLRDFISSQSMVSCIPYLGRIHVHKRTHAYKPPEARSPKDASLSALFYLYVTCSLSYTWETQSFWVSERVGHLSLSTIIIEKTLLFGGPSRSKHWKLEFINCFGVVLLFVLLAVSTKSHQICSWTHRFEVQIGSPIYLLLLWLERIITSFWVCGWLCVLRAEMATWRATSLQVLQLPS